jgi:ATP-dependent RNA circularization protein (DNA/RNA ligase family)
MSTATVTPDFQFRVVIPTADGQEVVGYFPTLLRAVTFQQAIIREDGLKVVVERFRNGYWWSDWG